MIPVLVLSDDYWHPGEVIERGFRGFKQNDYEFDFVMDAKDILTPEWIKKFPVIVNCKSNRISAANEHVWFENNVAEVGIPELETYIKEGGGLVSLHAANTAKDKTGGYGKLVGNVFVKHPPRCPIDVKITGGSHPIVQGVKDFAIRDEHYEIECFAENTTELFRTVSATGGDQTGGYTMECGKGRICVLTPGHILSVFEHPSFQQIVLNAIKWCMKK